MDEFRCVTDTIFNIKQSLTEIHEILFGALTLAQTVEKRVNDPNNWQGEAQLVGAAFLRLVVMYHGLLSTEEGYFDPILEAIETLEEYLSHDGDFYTNWEEHQRLSDI